MEILAVIGTGLKILFFFLQEWAARAAEARKRGEELALDQKTFQEMFAAALERIRKLAAEEQKKANDVEDRIDQEKP